MLGAKRIQIRNKMRSKELNRTFALRRMCLIQGKDQTIKQLFEQVQRQSKQNSNYEIISVIKKCMSLHQTEQNIYVVIGNYIFDHHQTYQYFIGDLLFQPRYLQNYAWNLFVIATIFVEEIAQQSQNQRIQTRNKMKDITSAMTQVCMQMMEKLKISHNAKDKEYYIWLYFMEILKLQFSDQLFEECHSEALKLFCDVLTDFPLQDPQPQQLIATWQCILSIMRKRNSIDQKQMFNQFAGAVSGVFYFTLKMLPQQREECLSKLLELIWTSPSSFLFFYFKKQLLVQLLYLLEQVPVLKQQIAQLMTNILSQVNIQQLMMLLDLGLHQHLTRCLQWSIKNQSNQCLSHCLCGLYALLNKLQEENETRLLRRVMSDIERLNFHLMVEGLSQNEQTQIITNHLHLIIDDFYSQEQSL